VALADITTRSDPVDLMPKYTKKSLPALFEATEKSGDKVSHTPGSDKAYSSTLSIMTSLPERATIASALTRIAHLDVAIDRSLDAALGDI